MATGYTDLTGQTTVTAQDPTTGDRRVIQNNGVVTPNIQPFRQPILGANTFGGTTGSSGSRSTNNNPNPVNNAPTPTSNSAEDAWVNSQYDSTISALDSAQKLIEGLQPQLQSNVNSAVDTNTQLANTQRGQGQRQLQTSGNDAITNARNAISAARQALQETLMGGKQRFGGGSGIYGALGEYAGTKFQQAQGQAGDVLQKAQSNVAELEQQLEESYKNTLNQINQWKSEQMTTIQENFTNKLLQINNDRQTAGQNKSIQKIQLLQDMRSRADAINTQAWTFQQNLTLQKAALGKQIGESNTQTQSLVQNGTNSVANQSAVGSQNAVDAAKVSINGSAPQATSALQAGSITQKKSIFDPAWGMGTGFQY